MAIQDKRTEEQFRTQLADLGRKSKEYNLLLAERAERGELITVRDVAIAAEHHQKFLDLLNDMQDAGYIGA